MKAPPEKAVSYPRPAALSMGSLTKKASRHPDEKMDSSRNTVSFLMALESFQIYLTARRKERILKMYTLLFIGVWLSLARAPGLGPGSRRFESCHPDCRNII